MLYCWGTATIRVRGAEKTAADEKERPRIGAAARAKAERNADDLAAWIELIVDGGCVELQSRQNETVLLRRGNECASSFAVRGFNYRREPRLPLASRFVVESQVHFPNREAGPGCCKTRSLYHRTNSDAEFYCSTRFLILSQWQHGFRLLPCLLLMPTRCRTKASTKI